MSVTAADEAQLINRWRFVALRLVSGPRKGHNIDQRVQLFASLSHTVNLRTECV